MRRLALILPLASIILIGCGGGGSSIPVAGVTTRSATMGWTDEMLSCVRSCNYGPTPVSRAIGLTTSAMYDAWAVLDPTAIGIYTQDESMQIAIAPSDESIDIAVSYAAYRMLVDLFPQEQSRLEAKMASLGHDPNMIREGTDSAAAIGNLVAQNIIRQRTHDGSNQSGGYSDTTGYTPVNSVDNVVDPNHWQPVEFVYPDGSKRTPKFLTPHWGLVKPFAMNNGAEFRCAPAPVFGSPEFESETNEVIEIQKNLTDRQKMEAEYWADGPQSELPPGHWVMMSQHIINQRGLGRADQARMLMLVGNAVMDAGIAAWDSKTFYDYVRPITAIRTMYDGVQIQGMVTQGFGVRWMDGKFWKPYQPASFITPPFAELPSGHSTFSAAAAQVIRKYTGSGQLDYGVAFPAGSSSLDPGFTPARPVALSYPTLSSAVEAAGLSRLYGGIHFRYGCEAGWDMGNDVGDKVFNQASKLFTGYR